MATTDRVERFAKYLHLARAAELRRRTGPRDHLLAVAAVEAQERGLPTAAEACRRKILAHNSAHIVGRFGSMAEAMRDERFAAFYRKAHRRYPLERVEQMLGQLGIDLGNERATYGDDDEYALDLIERISPIATAKEGVSRDAGGSREKPAEPAAGEAINPYQAPAMHSSPRRRRPGLAATPPTPWGNVAAMMLLPIIVIMTILWLGPCQAIVRAPKLPQAAPSRPSE